MRSFLALSYGVLVYAFCFGTLLYAMGFVGNIAVPKSIDSGAGHPLVESVIIDVLLLGLFAIQHSVMARRSFKRWWTRLVPSSIERSSFVLAASATLSLLFWQWRPIAEPVIWEIGTTASRWSLIGVFWFGWALLLVSTSLINHFELFGVRQVIAQFRGRDLPTPQFRTPFVYRYVRHPIYLGFLLAFWATPVMTAGHLLFAIGGTGYILLGIWFEERDLIQQFGEQYRAYRTQVGMLLPIRRER